MIDKFSEVESVLKEIVINNFLIKLFNGNNYPDVLQLDNIYQKFINYLTSDLSIFTSVKLSTLKSLKGYNFLQNSFWVPFVDMYIERLGDTVHSCVNLDRFHKYYTQTVKFLDDFEALFDTTEQIVSFRQSSSYQDFFRKPWPLNVYFELRFEEILDKFDNVKVEERNSSICQRNKETSATSSTDLMEQTFNLNVTQTFFNCLLDTWNEKTIYLRPLAQKFWNLSLTILKRYQYWLKEDIIKRYDHLPDWKSNSILLLRDVEIIITRLPGFYEDHIQLKLKVCLLDHDPSVLDKFEDTFCNDTIQKLKLIATNISMSFIKKTLSTPFKERCLRKITDIPKIYRHTKRIPSEASPYVFEMIGLFEGFLDSVNGSQAIQTPTNTSLINNLINQGLIQLNQSYLDAMKDLLINVQRTEESLLRLKKVKGLLISNNSDSTTNSATTNTTLDFDGKEVVTDESKIKKQLALDVKAYMDGIKPIMEKFKVNDEFCTLFNDLKLAS